MDEENSHISQVRENYSSIIDAPEGYGSEAFVVSNLNISI
jgi:hypothetical protein